METMIEVKDLTRFYGGVPVVDGIDFSVKKGDIFGLLGPNGAGKTTTLEIMEGLRRPHRGTVRLMGLDPQRDSRRLIPLMGIQLQTSSLPDSIKVEEAINLFSSYHQASPPMKLLEEMDLLEKRREQYHTLSTGQKRRLALLLAIAHDPPLIFLDEPTAGLDVGTRAKLHQMMKDLKEKGKTIILSTHDMAEAQEMADQVAILLRGRIVASGSPRELTAKGKGLTRISVMSTGDSLKDFSPHGLVKEMTQEGYYIYFVSNTAKAVSSIIKHIEGNHEEILDLRVERPSLEERFLELTKGGNNEGISPSPKV